MRIIDNINAVDAHNWHLLLECSSTKSFFQTKSCFELYVANSSFMTPFFLGVEEDGQLKGIIVGYIQADGGVLKRFLSRRAIINGGPLLADDISDGALCLLLTECQKKLKKDLDFVNHLRNKVGAHLSDEALDKMIQWNPDIYNENAGTNSDGAFL